MSRKTLSPKAKKIIDITLVVIQILIVLLAIVISAIVIANPVSTSAEVGSGKTKLLPVLTDSMNGDKEDSFAKGDLVVAVTPENVRTLEVGQIITFVGKVNGYDALITHRIVEVRLGENGLADTYVTRGDANPDSALEYVNPNNVLAVYKYHLKGVGAAINWLQQPTNFLLVIILPLAILFIYNIVIFIRMIVQAKLAKAAESSSAAPLDEEEIKRKAIEEYLASQNLSSDKDAVSEKEETDK